MSPAAFEHAVRYHCEQSHSNTCLAACAAMVLTRRDALPVDTLLTRETALCSELRIGRGGALVEVAAHALGSQMIITDPDLPASVKLLKSNLISGDWWLVALMHPGALADHYAHAKPRPLSRHGELPGPPAPSHAIVLVAAVAGGIVYLDPWFSAKDQPRHIDLPTFAGAWTGMYIPVGVDPIEPAG